MLSVCPLCICQRDFEGEALLPLGSKQPPKTNNYIQEIVYMHQNAPHQKKKKKKKKTTLKYLCAHYRANQYFSSPALIVHAGHEKANEAKLQRQCAHQSRLSAKGQSYLLDPRHQSCLAQDNRLLKWTTGDLPLDDSLWVGISVRESTDVVPSDLLCQSPHASYAVCCQRTLNRTLCGKRATQLNASWLDWHQIGSLELWGCKSKFSSPQIDFLKCCNEYLQTKCSNQSCWVAVQKWWGVQKKKWAEGRLFLSSSRCLIYFCLPFLNNINSYIP